MMHKFYFQLLLVSCLFSTLYAALHYENRDLNENLIQKSLGNNFVEDLSHENNTDGKLAQREEVQVVFCEDDDDDSSPLDEFPEYFTEEQLRQGFVVLHVFGAFYFFILLAIVCNDYFLPTVECICEDLNMPKDVAAATFMATATSMPEFFTNTISVLITDSDMGLGTIIGSLMFNTLGVAGLAALAITKPVQLDWWPIARDCTIYIFNTMVLLILAWGGRISFVQSCIMMGFLVLYYLICFYNNKFMPTIRVFVEDRLNCCLSTRYDFTEPPQNSAKAKLPIKQDPLNGRGLFSISQPESTNATPRESLAYEINLKNALSYEQESESIASESPAKLFALPHGESTLMKFWWIFTFPIKLLLKCLIPNPVTNRRFYPLTFLFCILMIGINAYMIVWLITAIGVTLGIPEIIMGLTFLAAGSAMPEAISSIISLRNGESGIGVSNSLGANSLAILLSLGVPWFVKNCISYGSGEVGNAITISSHGIAYNVLILVLCTIALFVVLSISGYRLTKRVGAALFSVYAILIVLQVLMEINVFFPNQCSK